MSMLLVSLGGAIGAYLRYLISIWLQGASKHYPWATWLINLSGSALLGFLYGIRELLPLPVYALLGIGFCGAYTTFSTFTVEVWQQIQQQKWSKAVVYILSSSLFCLLCAAAGLIMAEGIQQLL